MELFDCLHDLQDQVDEAKEQAYIETKLLQFKKIRSRGVMIASANNHKRPALESGEGLEWDGTLKDVRDAIAKAESNDDDSVYIYGGFDGADSEQDFKDFNYEPWITEWEIEVWKKD